MKIFVRYLTSCLLILVFIFQALPCGPSYMTPIFEFDRAPERPFENFAAGKIGIVKPSQRRVVLFAAYRYLNGGGFTADEQRALIEVWNADFNYEPYADREEIDEAVRNWTKKRAEVVGDKEQNKPAIYVEREYGGYDFFPNCTKNAFETATLTLADRIASHGAEDRGVKDWVTAQDAVFTNCASGRQMPAPPDETLPAWLQKDRAYQVAAAEFYSLNYAEAKRRFAEIAQDYDSPWQATADYLVGRTLIRQASLSKSESQSKILYTEAEQHLEGVAARNAKFGRDAEKLLGIVKYRLHPQERLNELAGKLAAQYGNENFRQDLIDFNWLVDKFEKETLEAEEKRRETGKQTEISNTNSTVANTALPSNASVEIRQNEEDLKIYLYAEDYSQNWTFFVPPDATDEEALAKAEKIVGRPLTDKMKEIVRTARRQAYQSRFDQNKVTEYQGGYYGKEEASLSILPEFLRRQDLTDWLFTFQIENNEAYLHALSRYKETSADLWLLTALVKAEKSSTELNRLLQAAGKIGPSSPAFPTIAYHRARILIELGKTAEARKILDDLLNSSLDLPISATNQLLELRVKIADTLGDFLRFAQRKPFAFDWDGQTGTIDEIIAEQKSWYDPKYNEKTREEYEKEIEENFAEKKIWQDRLMFDSDTVEVVNQHFPTDVLLAAHRSPALPEYMRERFALVIWTRAALLRDFATAAGIAPEVIKYKPGLELLMNRFLAAKTPAAKETAAIYLILKNPMLTPYLEDGLPRGDNEANTWDINDWWCAPYETEYDEKLGDSVPRKIPARPAFLTAVQTDAAQVERQKLKATGDAPKFLGEQVLAWAKRAPADKRMAESLFIVWEANGWTKYGCGSNIELREQIGNVLKKNYPRSEYAKKVLAEEKEQN